MEFQLSYFKSWKIMLWKCCTQYVSTFGKLSSGHRTGKGQFSFQSKQKAMQRMLKLLHNCTHLTCWQSNAQNSPSQASAICELWTSRCSTWFQKRQRNQRLNCQHPLDHWKSKRVPEKMPFTVWATINSGKFERAGNTRPLDLPLEKSVCRSGSNS